MHADPAVLSSDTQINWLELARLAAQGSASADEPADLVAGVQRLATLAAATHRGTLTRLLSVSEAATPLPRVHGRTPQAHTPGTEAGRLTNAAAPTRPAGLPGEVAR
jgi:hypothetical protein